jgi:amino acid adenylation domain-containing protein
LELREDRRPNVSPAADPVGEGLPLTAPQAAIWFGGGEIGSTRYIIGEVVVLRGQLDTGAFHQAIKTASGEAEAFRTRFRLAGTTPVMDVMETVDPDYAVIDVSAAADPERAGEAEIRHLLQRPFDLSNGMSHRDRLIRLGPTLHWWLRLGDHLAEDAMSARLIGTRVAALYNAERRGVEPPPADFGSYRDFAATERGYLGSVAHRADIAFWKETLAASAPPTVLARHPVPGVVAPTQEIRRPVDPERLDALAAAAEALGVSRPALLQAAFLALLAQTAETETPGCVITLLNRLTRKERTVPGTFSTTAPFGVTVRGSQRFADVAMAVSQGIRAVYRHMRLSPPLMRAAGLDPWRGTVGGASFNAMDFLAVAPFDGLDAEVRNVSVGLVDDLALSFFRFDYGRSDTPGLLSWRYNPARYGGGEVGRLAARYNALLDAILADPNILVSDLPRLPVAEEARIAAWETGPALPPGLDRESVQRRFARRAAEAPGQPAVDADGRTVTYGELAAAMNRVARRLREGGLAPEAPVGLCLAPSPELAAGFLGILAAGGAVVPLEPSLPPARLQAMAAGLGCPAVLAHGRTLPRLPDFGPDVRVFDLDGSFDGAAGPEALPPDLDPARLACVFHTSGSTGTPKPVGIEHGALATKIASIAALFGFGGDECAVVTVPIAFDPFLQQLLLPLTHGGRAWIAERDLMMDGPAFWREVREHGVTHLSTVPATLTAQLEAVPEGEFPSIRRLVCGGDRMPPGIPARARALIGVTAVWNMYGPTEGTIDATGFRVDTEALYDTIPIGRPLAGYTIRILDETMRRVPIGTAGELCIGGYGVARGYLGREEETRAAFVPDPFGPPGARLYKTGDRAVWNDDGTIAFAGRRDHQLKLRGQRIELGEIETALLAHPAVREAVVVHRADGADGQLAAYFAGNADAGTLRRHLAERLPPAAVPTAIVPLTGLPHLPSGKIDRAALPDPRDEPARPMPRGGRGAALERAIAGIWAELLGRERIDPQANLFEIGAYSLLIPRAQARISALAGRPVPTVALFQYASVAALAAHLAGGDGPTGAVPETVAETSPRSADDHAIAVVGYACRFPGADDRETFWANLIGGVESIRRPDAADLAGFGVPPSVSNHPDRVSAHGAIDGIDLFDHQTFGCSAREAAEMDPQQRLLLETAWRALDDAGCDPARQGPVGAFVGVGFNAYFVDHVLPVIGPGPTPERYAVAIGNDKDFAATRLAYKLGLTGPAVTVQTACSTSLTAVAEAVAAVRGGRCRVALAGAVSLTLPAGQSYVHTEGGITSRSGVCRPYDAASDGTVLGSGAGVVVLKRLADALTDGDTIHGVIRGVGIDNDGTAKAGFTAPSVEGQARAIRAALADAGLDAGGVAMVEGHGTGTALGDPIEVAALNLAYRGAAPGSILLGSVKSNIGHIDAAAGMAGLVKALLALKHGVVPPSLHITAPNPHLPLADGPFRLAAKAVPLARGACPLRAGVSSFGMGGTNIHVVVEEAPPAPAPALADSAPQLIVLSASAALARDALAEALATRLDGAPDLPDAAWTLQAGRRRLSWRRFAVARDGAEAAVRLRSEREGDHNDGARPLETPALALLFPGQGAQHPGMGRTLYRGLPAFRDSIDRAARVLQGTAAADLVRLIDADPDDAEAARRLANTEVTQPALFAVEHALAEVLAGWGIEAEAFAGHSVGEYVAAARAGVMGFEDALALVAERGRLMASAPRGAMLALSMPEAEAAELIRGRSLSLATVNGPRQCVVAGTEEAVAGLEAALTGHDRPARRLNVSHAFHCALMDPILDAFGEAVAKVRLMPPSRPFLSNVSGDWIRPEEATDPAYWVRHLRGTVRFGDNLKRLLDSPSRVVIEAGPGQTLTRLARAGGAEARRALALQAVPADGHAALLDAVGRLWLLGVEPDWAALHGGSGRRRVPLPGYPFQRTRHWLEPRPAAAAVEMPAAPALPPAPGTGCLEAMLRIWGDAMGRPDIEPDDDFFALGGDSLLALRIAARVRQELGVAVPVAALLQSPTARAAARLADELSETAAPAERERGVL